MKTKINPSSIGILILFLGISLLLLLFHEPWRDEAQAWLIARDAPTYGAMISTMGYEGTPALWHTLLFSLAKLHLPYRSMQILHFIVTFSAVFLFLKYSPFPKGIKILFPFGYFILYEYNTISRNYALSMLFLYLIAMVYQKKMKTIIYPFLLFLLANSNLMSLFISGVLFADYCWEYFCTQRKIKQELIIIIILAVSFFIPIIQLLPPPDAEHSFQADFSIQRIGGAASSVVSAFLPLPKLQPTFWGTRLLYFTSPLLILLVVPLFALSLVLLWPYKRAFCLYIFSSLGLFAIFFFVSIGTLRHHGFLFLMFIFSSWIALKNNSAEKEKKKVIPKINSEKEKFLNTFLVFILLIHLFAAGTAAYYELNYHFSNAKDAAHFLKEKNFINNNTNIAAYRSVIASSLAPYLSKEYRFYCLERGEYCSRFIGTDKTVDISSLNENMHYFENTPHQNHIILLTDQNYIKSIPNNQRYVLIASFEEAISNENYYVYRFG